MVTLESFLKAAGLGLLIGAGIIGPLSNSFDITYLMTTFVGFTMVYIGIIKETENEDR